jgi:hypothetical protein
MGELVAREGGIIASKKVFSRAKTTSTKDVISGIAK